MRIDLIIPFFNDEKGLINTIMSIGNYTQNVDITIIDDCSTELTQQFPTVIQTLSLLTDHPIQILKTPKNIGPGLARQFGIENTHNDFIVFLDCGDIFYSPFSLSDMYNTIIGKPEAQVISFSHYSETLNGLDIILSTHNRVGGKIYRRKFLENYNITFSNTTANEDIHFNKNCRIICKQIERNTGKQALYMFDDCKTVWTYSENSITRKNNYAFFYKEQNIGSAIAAKHTLENLYKNNIDIDIINDYLYNTFIYMYFSFLFTSIKRPEFINESLSGALYFYNNCFKDCPIDTQLFTEKYWEELQIQANDPFSDIKETIPTLSIFDFIKLLNEKKENN